MNVVYLIGNGFDLSLGLHTGASEFIESFVAEKSKDTDEYILSLIEDMKERGVETWSDFEKESGAYSTRFANEYSDDAREYGFVCSEIYDHLSQMLEKEQNKLSEEFIATNAVPCLHSLIDFKNEVTAGEQVMIETLRKPHSNEHWEYTLLNFNYTNTLDRFIDYCKKNDSTVLGPVIVGNGQNHLISETIHVHNELSAQIICGVDDIDQIEYEPFRTNVDVITTLVKKNAQDYVRRDEDTRGLQAINTANIICIYGMSLGSTDRRWWQAILDRVRAEPSTLIVLMSHEISNKPARTMFQKRDLIEGARNRLFDSAEITDSGDKDFLSSRIIVIPSDNILKITEPL